MCTREITRAQFYRCRIIYRNGRAFRAATNKGNVAHRVLLDSSRVVNSREAAMRPARQYARVSVALRRGKRTNTLPYLRLIAM